MPAPLFNGRVQVFSTTANGSNFDITGLFFDETSTFTAADALIGDMLYDASGHSYTITNIASTSPFSITVSDNDSAGAPINGAAVLFRSAGDRKIPIATRVANGVSENLINIIRNEAAVKISEEIDSVEPSVVTQTTNGLMLAADKVILDDLHSRDESGNLGGSSSSVAGTVITKYPGRARIRASKALDENTGLVFSNGKATITCADDTILHSVVLFGTSSETDGSNNVTIEINLNTIVGGDELSITLPQFNIIDMSSKPSSGPSDSLPYNMKQTSATANEMIGLENGKITFRAKSMNSLVNWAIVLTF